MTKEQWMKKAIAEAKKASLKYDEVPIGCVIVHNDRIIAWEATAAKRSSRRRLMPKWRRSPKRAESSVRGGSMIVIFMLPLNLVRCVPGRSFNPGSGMYILAPMILKAAVWVPVRIFWMFRDSIITLPMKAVSFNRNVQKCFLIFSVKSEDRKNEQKNEELHVNKEFLFL